MKRSKIKYENCYNIVIMTFFFLRQFSCANSLLHLVIDRKIFSGKKSKRFYFIIDLIILLFIVSIIKHWKVISSSAMHHQRITWLKFDKYLRRILHEIQHALHLLIIKPINTNMERSKLSRRRKNVSYLFLPFLSTERSQCQTHPLKKILIYWQHKRARKGGSGFVEIAIITKGLMDYR